MSHRFLEKFPTTDRAMVERLFDKAATSKGKTSTPRSVLAHVYHACRDGIGAMHDERAAPGAREQALLYYDLGTRLASVQTHTLALSFAQHRLDYAALPGATQRAVARVRDALGGV